MLEPRTPNLGEWLIPQKQAPPTSVTIPNLFVLGQIVRALVMGPNLMGSWGVSDPKKHALPI